VAKFEKHTLSVSDQIIDAYLYLIESTNRNTYGFEVVPGEDFVPVIGAVLEEDSDGIEQTTKTIFIEYPTLWFSKSYPSDMGAKYDKLVHRYQQFQYWGNPEAVSLQWWVLEATDDIGHWNDLEKLCDDLSQMLSMHAELVYGEAVSKRISDTVLAATRSARVYENDFVRIVQLLNRAGVFRK